MNSNEGRSRVLSELAKTLRRDPDVEFAVAFGSTVAGASRPSSDVDVAVKFDDDLSSHERFRKRCLLSGELQREGRPFVDVSDIEALPVDVAYDAVRGELLCGDERAFRRAEAEIEATYQERREEIRRHQRDVIERIAEDGLHG